MFRQIDANEESNWFVRFGKERFQLRLETYKKVFVSDLLLKTLFGDGYCKIWNLERRNSDSKTRLLVHIRSRDRIVRLFNIGGKCGVSHMRASAEYQSICRTVNVVDKDGREMQGFIVGETSNQMRVCLLNDVIIMFDFVRWDSNLNTYVYNN